MAEILGLGVTHYPPLAGRDENMAGILELILRDPALPAAQRGPEGWPAPMREEWGEDEPPAPLSDADRAAIEAEIADLDGFARLATSIDHNAKGKALLKALGIAMNKATELGAEQKAITRGVVGDSSRRKPAAWSLGGARTIVNVASPRQAVAADRPRRR